MAYYLQMNGTADYLKMPLVTMDSIEIDCMLETTRTIILDARAGLSNGHLNSFAFGAGWTLVQMDGSTITALAQVPLAQRVVITATAASFLDDVNFFSNNTNATPQKGRIYKITCKLAGAVVALYDMSLGNVQDQSGNGKHATLSGGTWVSDASGTTHTLASSANGVSVATSALDVVPAAIQLSANGTGVGQGVAVLSVQNASMLLTSSANGVSQGTASLSVIRGLAADKSGVSWGSASLAGLTVQLAASANGVAVGYADLISGAVIVGYIELSGEFDFVLDIAGELLGVADTLGEMEPLTVDILGVIGMAIQNAEISIYRGDDKDIRDTVKNKDGSPTNLSGASVEWMMKKRQMDTAALFEKNSPTGITITDPSNGVFVVHLTSGDTDIQHGRYFYVAKVTDALGKTTTVSVGSIVINP